MQSHWNETIGMYHPIIYYAIHTNLNLFFLPKAVDAAVKALKSGSVSSGDLARAKEQLKTAILVELESTNGILSDIGQQAVLTGTVQSPAEVIAAIDALTSSDVNAVSYHYF